MIKHLTITTVRRPSRRSRDTRILDYAPRLRSVLIYCYTDGTCWIQQCRSSRGRVQKVTLSKGKPLREAIAEIMEGAQS